MANIPMPTADEIVRSAADAAFGRPLLTNVMRGVVVEAIVAKALVDWTWCSADYAPCDFLREDARTGMALRLEVKQSAACQSWPTEKPSEIRWDVAPRQAGRYADIYVLAVHPGETRGLVDHRDPAQWRFLVVASDKLPAFAKTIGKAPVERLAEGVGFEGLSTAVEATCATIVVRREPVLKGAAARAPSSAKTLQIG